MLARGEVHDPKIGFITLTRVQVSPDLQVARVYYTSLGDPAARKDTQKALDRATPFLRRQIGSRVQLRRVPEIEFRFDESIAQPGPHRADPAGPAPGRGRARRRRRRGAGRRPARPLRR